MNIIDYDKKYEQDAIELINDIKFNELGWARPVSPDFMTKFSNGHSHIWFAVEKDKVIGTIALQDMDNGQGYLKRMYLAKEYRGRGAAQELFDTLMNYAKDKGFTEIYLGTLPNAKRAIAFYEKNGFIEIVKLPDNFDDGNDTFFMKLKF